MLEGMNCHNAKLKIKKLTFRTLITFVLRKKIIDSELK